MEMQEDIPSVWSEWEQIIDYKPELPGNDQDTTNLCELIILAESQSKQLFSDKSKNLKVPIVGCRLIQDSNELMNLESGYYAKVAKVEISTEDWSMYQNGHDISFYSDKPIPVIVYECSKGSNHIDSKVVGLGLFDGDFLTIARNFY